jgi:hypothetical protein
MMTDEVLDEGNEGIDPAVLAEAAEQGWVPQDQWKGKAEEWSDAETFVRRGREINPILRKALKKERERTAALETELRATGATVAELREYLAKVEERATANALASLKRARTAALEAGDHAAAAEAEEQMDQLKDSPSAVPKAKTATTQTIHPQVQSWMDDNPWYNDDEDMKAYADGIAQRLMQARAGTTFEPKDILPTVTDKVKKMFPAKFQGDAPPSAMFEGGGGGGTGGTRSGLPTGGKSAFDKLPAEARSQFKRFYEAGYYIDLKTKKPLDLKAAQAEYLKEYE